MVKGEQKIILLSIFGGISIWVIGALIESRIFSTGLFASLFTRDGMHQFYFGSILLASFIIFGIILSRSAAKRRQLEDALREKEKPGRMFIERADDAVFILDAEGKKAGQIVSVTQAAAEMHGYTVNELLSHNIRDLDAPDAAQEVSTEIQPLLTGKWISEERKHLKKDGTVFPVEIRAGILELGNHKYILAVNSDIAGRKADEKALKECEEKYRSVMESVGDSIYMVDRDYRYLFMNKKHLERLGLTGDSFLRQAYSDFHSPEEVREFSERVDRVFNTGETVQHEHLSHRDDRYFLRTLSPVKDAGGSIRAVTVVSKDVNDLKRMQEKLRNLSLTDELTVLYNRRGFFAMIEQMTKCAKRDKRGVFLLYADLDNLKGINDRLGHHEGDLALIDTAKVLKATYRESDVIARIGGDEFVVVPVGSSGDNIEIITARLQENLDDHNAKSDRQYALSLSIGISYYDPESSLTIDELLMQAEKSMYEQKKHKQKS